MEIKLSFLGAAQNVTGSRHMLEANGVKILVDCGFYQERQFKDRNWDKFPVKPSKIDAVLLTHAHLDHCGLLPKLAREGFNGPIYCTGATAEIAKIILLDSAHLQEEDAEYKKKRHAKEGRKSPRPIKPLYTTEDAEACFPQFTPVKYREVQSLGPDMECTFYDAGHVLGSSIIRVKVKQNSEERIVIFSGDMGRPDRPIVCDPTVLDEADYVLIESTYGNRVHNDVKDIKTAIGEVVNSTVAQGGKIVVPSFALERSQELLYYFNELLQEGTIKPIKIFLDSPMANKITRVFQKHPEMFDEEMAELVHNHNSPFKLANLKMVKTTDESKGILNITKPFVVIAGSGMCTGGRVKHHLVNYISSPQNTIMFVGYQAIGTLGRRIVEGEKEVRILGENRIIKAKIVRINGFSAHADKVELLNWLKSLKKAPRKVFVVHGEKNSSKHFAEFVKEETGWDVMVPNYKDTVILD